MSLQYIILTFFHLLQHEPARIVDIDFSQPKLTGSRPLVGDNTDDLNTCSISAEAMPSFEEKRAFMCGLRRLYPKAAIVSVFFENEGQVSRPSAKALPRTITSYYHPRYCTLSPDILQQEIMRVFEQIQVTDAEAQYLAQCTSLQAQSSTWFEHKKGSLTSSHFRAICHTSHDKPSHSLINQILHSSPTPKVASLTWGIEHESVARKQYEASMEINSTYGADASVVVQ